MIRYHGQSWSGIQFQFDIFFSAHYDNPLITEIMPNFLYHLCFVFLVWTFVFPMIPQVQMIRHLLLQFLHKAYLKRNQLFVIISIVMNAFGWRSSGSSLRKSHGAGKSHFHIYVDFRLPYTHLSHSWSSRCRIRINKLIN